MTYDNSPETQGDAARLTLTMDAFVMQKSQTILGHALHLERGYKSPCGYGKS